MGIIGTMNDIWDFSPLKGSRLLVLLALAWHSDNKRQAHVSTPYIASKCRISVRYAKRILNELEELGYISIRYDTIPDTMSTKRTYTIADVTSLVLTAGE